MVDEQALAKVFLKHSQVRYAELIRSRQTLAHYTTASNACRIIDSRRVTLRNARLMNDFQEIGHGMNCISDAWGSKAGGGAPKNRSGRLGSLIEGMFPGLLEEVENSVLSETSRRHGETYLFSLIEHDDDEDGQYGKLSMWRAYGSNAGVAIVLKKSVINLEDSSPNGMLSPVLYRSREDFIHDFGNFVDDLESGRYILQQAGREAVGRHLKFALEVAMMSLKHPGFREEKEWRLIYSPIFLPENDANSEILNIKEGPQRVRYFPLDGIKMAKNGETTIADAIEKIIIGPTSHPYVTYEALKSKLTLAGVPDPENRIIVSSIPIRR